MIPAAGRSSVITTMAGDITTRTTTASSSSTSNSNNTPSADVNAFQMAVISSSAKVSIVKQLQQRLVLLTDNSSRESLQTVARWMAFHRRHSVALSTALMSCIQDQLLKNNRKRAFLYLSVAHDLILMGSVEDITNKSFSDLWDKLKQFRVHLLQLVFAPTATALCDGSSFETTWKEKFNDMIPQWESCMSQDDVLYPMIQTVIAILDQTAKASTTITSKNEEQEEELVTAMASTTADMDDTKNLVKQEEEEEAMQTSPDNIPSSSWKTDEIKVEPLEKLKIEPTLSGPEAFETTIQIKTEDVEPAEDVTATSSSHKKQRLVETTSPVTEEAFGTVSIGSGVTPTIDTSVAVDFEKEGIPQENVSTEQILIPYRSIATSQIARELRHDAIERISTIVNNVRIPMEDDPKQVQQVDAQQFTDEFLDLPLREALQTIEHYRNAIQHQYTARRHCVELLLKSRCQFGSKEAAEEFYSLQDKIKLLQQHISLLQDAMELEGLDFENVKKEEDEAMDSDDNLTMDQRLQSLESLSWYTRSYPT